MRSFLEWLHQDESKKIPDGAIKIHLPKVEQETAHSCGAAALRAVAGFFGVGPNNENDFIELLQSHPENGTKPCNIVKIARMLGLHAFSRQQMTIDSLKDRLAKHIPVICVLQAWGPEGIYPKNASGHYIVAIGFDDERIYFEDPSLTKTRGFLTYREFLDRWHDQDADGKKYERFGISIWQNGKPKGGIKITESVEVK